jgi:hypothetical protein
MHMMFNKLSAALSSFSAEAIARGVFLALLAFAPPAMAQDSPKEPPKEAPSGQITIEQIQVAFIGSGAVGGGTLTYEGKEYKFKVAGLGVGGFGASRLSAKGEVYGLKKLADFAGPYGEVRMGWAAGDMGSARFWLHNAKGVYLKLEGTRQGLQVAAGAEGVIITME